MMSWIKSTGLILLAVGILFQQASKSFIVFDYLVNKKYIAAVLCENRNKPQMHCNGKCHLRKQLQRDNERQGNEKQNVNEKQEICWWEKNTQEQICFVQPSIESPNNFVFIETISSVPLASLFHPPCVQA